MLATLYGNIATSAHCCDSTLQRLSPGWRWYFCWEGWLPLCFGPDSKLSSFPILRWRSAPRPRLKSQNSVLGSIRPNISPIPACAPPATKQPRGDDSGASGPTKFSPKQARRSHLADHHKGDCSSCSKKKRKEREPRKF